MNDQTTRFGMLLRGRRLCWSHSAERNLFIRVQDRPGDRWAVEIVPAELKFLTKGVGEYRIIGNVERVMQASPALAGIRNPSGPIELLLDEQGNEVSP